MKKILVAFILLSGLFTISGCTNLAHYYGFKNSSNQSKTEIQEKIAFYSNEMKADVEGLISSNQSLSAELEEEYPPGTIVYQREDLPPNYDYPYDPDIIDPHFLMNSAMALDSYNEALNSCDDFEEDVFCTIEYEDYNLYLKVRSEDDQLLIESYRYYSYTYVTNTQRYVNADIMYLDMIDEKIYLEHVRDFRVKNGDEEINQLYYDLYFESGDMLNISVNMNSEADVYYQNYVKSTQDIFSFSNNEEGLHFGYKDTVTEKYYSISFDQNQELKANFISYGTFDPSFRYDYNAYSTPQVRLIWNMLDVTGWDDVVVFDYQYDRIYKDGTQILTDFTTTVEVYDYTTAESYIYVTPDEITKGLVSLSDHGLSFDHVTIEELNEDIPYFQTNYLTILEGYGFFEDMTQNKTLLYDLIPFFGDDEIISYLFDEME